VNLLKLLIKLTYYLFQPIDFLAGPHTSENMSSKGALDILDEFE
jgi:hypothetical protein